MLAVCIIFIITTVIVIDIMDIGDGDKPRLVTSKDLIPRPAEYAYAPANATSIEEANNQLNNGISIVSLAPVQRLNLSCEAKLVFFFIFFLLYRVLVKSTPSTLLLVQLP